MEKSQRRETSKHREAFEAWYAAARSFRQISPKLAVPRRTLFDWADAFDWHDRADARDHEAQRIADEEAAKERAARQKRRRKAGELLAVRGMEFLHKNQFDNAADAIRAIKYGTEIERKEDGIPDWVLMILNADDSALEMMSKYFGGPDAASSDASALIGEELLPALQSTLA